MLDADWYAGDRAIPPERIELFSGEQRIVSVSLASSISVGEAINSSGMEVTLTKWGRPAFSYETALVDSLTWNVATKTVSQKIDAGLLPFDTPIACQFEFDVQTQAGPIDRRSVVRVILVRV